MAHRCLIRRSPLHLRTSIIRTRPAQVLQARQIWWWSRKDISEYSVDDPEHERFLRRQKHVRNRYAKIIRRRAMWDRDPTPNPWPWQREQQKREDAVQNGLKTFHKDFDSFRKAVDRAMDRDPYGTLFGRRLRSPPSANNSSWTSFSWIFDPQDIKEEKSDNLKTTQATQSPLKPSNVAESPRSTQSSSPHVSTDNTMATAAAAAAENVEYEYDPISMRRVPKVLPTSAGGTQSASKPTEAAPTIKSARDSLRSVKKPVSDAVEQPSIEPKHKTIFEALFGENSVDIPVKTYTPKVYGYNAKEAGGKNADKTPRSSQAGFENSRKREFQALRASTLGNTIDTTAEFGGKYSSDSASLFTAQDNASSSAKDGALFSGTAYEHKAGDILGRAQDEPQGSTWLEQEGFAKAPSQALRNGFNQTPSTNRDGSAHSVPIKKYVGVESSLNRLNASPKAKDDVLQPALDRSGKATTSSRDQSPREALWESKVAAAEKAEDIDLLRTSDVRESMKPKGHTKQDIESRKHETRERLEKGFAARQAESDKVVQSPRDSGVGLDHVWKHLESNPNGIVARTMKSVSAFNDNLKKYVRSQNNLNQPLTPSAESSAKTPTTFKQSKPLVVQTDSPKEVIDAEQQRNSRIMALQRAKVEVTAQTTMDNEKLDRLATEIKSIYEERYGKIDVDHRDNAGYQRPHPLSTASVKEGVVRNPIIVNHTTKFEPAYARMIDDMKDVRREIHEARLHLKDLRAAMTKRPWAELEAERLAEYARDRLVEEEASASGLDEPVFREARKVNEDPTETLDLPSTETKPTKRDTDPKGLDEPVTAYPAAIDPTSKMAADLRAQSDTRPTMEAPVFTPSGSPIWNDEQPPPIAELKAAAAEFKSPVVILVHDPSSNTVKVVASPHLPDLTPRANLNPFSLLAGLDETQAASFLGYFPRLQNAGYELFDGDKDKLIFRKTTLSTISATQSLSSKDLTSGTSKEAATVLNEIPADIEPPGPCAPIPPPSSYPSSRSRPAREHRVRRQETVFSGTTTAPTIPVEPVAKESASTPPAPPFTDPSYDYETQTPKPGVFSRAARTIRRVTLTVLGLAAGAYTIGFIAEGIGAQEQASRGIGDAAGPRKKMVLPVESADDWRRGTRPGIYSTESSRRE